MIDKFDKELWTQIPESLPYINQDAVAALNRELVNLARGEEYQDIEDVRRLVCQRLLSINEMALLLPGTLQALAGLIGPPDMVQHRTGAKKSELDVHIAQAWASIWGRERAWADSGRGLAKKVDDIFIKNIGKDRLKRIKAENRQLIERVKIVSRATEERWMESLSENGGQLTR